MSSVPKLKTAVVDFELTYDDDTTLAYRFGLDNPDGAQPIDLHYSMGVDEEVSIEGYPLNTWVTRKPGDRAVVAFSVSGRGPTSGIVRRAASPLSDAVSFVVNWLDAKNMRNDHEITLRILKVVEEAGEAASARIDNLGQNPRKRQRKTARHIADELADVIITAAVAITSLGFDYNEVLGEKCQRVIQRIESQ
jgi:NTP pyrophosphatase (non-canonical NTP hydrolase)